MALFRTLLVAVARGVLGWLGVGVLALVVVAACGHPQAVRMVGNAMAPTLKNGDIRIFDTGAYSSSSPKRGDIVLFQINAERIGRVIGLPGETIGIASGKVSVNGAVLAEPYLAPGTQTTAPQDSYSVPRASYFIMEDNREHSTDSREYGPVPRGAIQGKL